MTLSLYIDGAWRDCESDVNNNSLVMNWEFDSLDDPAKYYSEFSYTFKLPRTRYNDNLFSNEWRLDSITSHFNSPIKYRLLNDKQEVISVGIANVSNWSEKEYQVQLNGSLGVAFKRLLSSGWAATDDPEYTLFEDPLAWNGSDYTADLRLDKNLVACSWALDSLVPYFSLSDLRSHYSTLLTDYSLASPYTTQMALASSIIGFMPMTQGRYKSFDSTKWTTSNRLKPVFNTISSTTDIDLGDGLNEWQMSEFRSYYQTPYVYVQKLWDLYKEKCESMTGYRLVLDERWYNENNLDLKDVVYTLNNLGATLPEKPEANSSVNTSTTSNVTLPSNAASDYDDYKITGLASNTNQYLYSGYYTVGTNQTIEEVIEIPMKFTNPDNVIMPPIIPQFGAKAYNSGNPIYATYDILDSNDNVLASSVRPYTLVPLLQTRDFTEEWEHPLREAFETISDVICFYYDGEGLLENKSEFNFGRVQLTARWKNSGNSQQVRVRWWLRFAYDWVPTKVYSYDDGNMYKVPWYNGYTGGDANGRIRWEITADRQTNIYDPARSGSKLTMSRLFKDLQPFQILLKYSKMYNLVWAIDDWSNTITVKRKYDFFYDCQGRLTDRGFGSPSYNGFLDITDRIDLNKGYTIEPKAFNGKSVTLGFKESGDMYSKKYKDKFGKQYGDIILYTADTSSSETIQAFNKDENNTLYSPIVATDIVSPRDKVETLLSTKYAQYETLPYPSNQTSEGEQANVFGQFFFRNPLIAVPNNEFAHYKQSGTPYVIITDDDATEIADQVYAWHSANDGVKVFNLPQFFEHNRSISTCLWFGEPREMYYDVPQQVLDTEISLYSKEWARYLDDSYSTQNKLLTCYAYIDGQIYSRLKVNPLVKIENCIYLLQKMEYSEQNHYGKLELRQIFNLDDLIADATPIHDE